MASFFNRMTSRVPTAAGLMGSALVASLMNAAHAIPEYNLPVGVTEISRDVFDLHMLVFWICVAIGLVVFGVMFYSIFAHRHSKGAKPADFHHSTVVEIVWTTIPFIILIAMAIPAASMLVRMEDTSNSDLTVKVTGFQWGWHYEYLDNGVQHYSMIDAESNAARRLGSGADVTKIENYLRDVDKPLVLPTDKKIKFLITSIDVIHSWWVPELGGKKDANPGAVNAMWAKIDEPGRYDGKCTELCGKDHGYMPIVVKAVSPAGFDAYIQQQTAAGNTATPAVAAAE